MRCQRTSAHASGRYLMGASTLWHTCWAEGALKDGHATRRPPRSAPEAPDLRASTAANPADTREGDASAGRVAPAPGPSRRVVHVAAWRPHSGRWQEPQQKPARQGRRSSACPLASNAPWPTRSARGNGSRPAPAPSGAGRPLALELPGHQQLIRPCQCDVAANSGAASWPRRQATRLVLPKCPVNQAVAVCER
jgi:hypothetical protein